jgi:tetratricopeptide (TPR) repeat protein
MTLMRRSARFIGSALPVGGRLALLFATAGVLACGSARSVPPAVGPGAQDARIEMDPVVIEATPAAGGVQIESFDAQELFELAGAALSQQRFDDAIRGYDRLIKQFPESTYARPSMYNRGLAQQGKKDWARAVDSFRELADKYADHADAKDALFKLGESYAELENWPSSGEVFARLLERKDLNSDDRIEAIARRGFAQLKLGDLDTAEKTFHAALIYRQQIEKEERLATDFFLAFAQYNLAQISHERFRRTPIRLPEAQMDRDLEEKAALLLKAQRSYIETIKYGNPRWASAAGFQVGSLYEELYDAFMTAPIPAGLDDEGRDVYREELRKKIRVLLEKSVRWYRENLLMVERLGVDTDWAQKTKVAYAKLMRMLDPGNKTDPVLPGGADGKQPEAPGTPAAPERGGSPRPAPPGTGDEIKRRVL